MPTVFLIILYTPIFLLEIRVIVKISSHPWYPLICDEFRIKTKQKKFKMADSKKLSFSTTPKSWAIVAKISQILRRHSLWTAPKRKTLAFKFHAQKRILRLKTCQNTFAQWYNGWVSKLLDRFLGYCVLQRPCEFKNVSKTSVIKFNVILPWKHDLSTVDINELLCMKNAGAQIVMDFS